MNDIMLNIVRGTKAKKVPEAEPKLSKTDAKKIKYANKMKMRNKSVKSRDEGLNKDNQIVNNANQFNMGLMPLPKEDESLIVEKSQNKRLNKDRLSKTETNDKTENNSRKNGRREENRNFKSSGNRFEGRSRQNKDQERENLPSTFKPEMRKEVTVTELMPEKQELDAKIDINDLDAFNLEPKLKDSLSRSGVEKLTEIQMKSYESLLNGVDSIIKASTGSGKTLAYLVPIVNKIIKNKTITKREDGTCVIVVCPTRELCVQGQKEANRCLKRCPFIISGCLFGGEETNHEKSRLRKGTNILFCTPGRVLYHLEQTKSFKTDNLQCIVFEEADRTLDMGFQESVHKIIKILSDKVALSHVHKILVSAHFNSKVSSLLEELEMSNPKFIGFENSDSEMQLSKLKESKDIEINTSSQLKQQYVLMSEEEKVPLLLAYLGVLKNCKALIFVSTIDEVEFFDYLLTNLKFRDSNGSETQVKLENRPVYKIHGDLDQKLRSKTYLEFRESKEAILISTEVASRGLDFPDLSHIILFDVPPSITDYGNRVGRSARFNQSGVSLLMLHYIESDYAEKIRYYAPNLQVIEKDIVYDSYGKILKSMNIGDSSLHYLEGLVRTSVKNDDEKYQVARKAYVSMLRAYARLPERQIFAVKKLNLKLLARSFGLNNAQADNNYNPKAKNSHLEASRKKRKVEDVKKMEVSEYL